MHIVFQRHQRICREGLAPDWRHFATLYFIFVADSAESELGVLDLIQVPTVDATEMYQHFPGRSSAEGTFCYPCPWTLTSAEKTR